jgi:hypothetical protein
LSENDNAFFFIRISFLFFFFKINFNFQLLPPTAQGGKTKTASKTTEKGGTEKPEKENKTHQRTKNKPENFFSCLEITHFMFEFRFVFRKIKFWQKKREKKKK